MEGCREKKIRGKDIYIFTGIRKRRVGRGRDGYRYRDTETERDREEMATMDTETGRQTERQKD